MISRVTNKDGLMVEEQTHAIRLPFAVVAVGCKFAPEAVKDLQDFAASGIGERSILVLEANAVNSGTISGAPMLRPSVEFVQLEASGPVSAPKLDARPVDLVVEGAQITHAAYHYLQDQMKLGDYAYAIVSIELCARADEPGAARVRLAQIADLAPTPPTDPSSPPQG